LPCSQLEKRAGGAGPTLDSCAKPHIVRLHSLISPRRIDVGASLASYHEEAFKTDSPAAYAEAIENGREIMKKAGITAATHVYQATYAGPHAGTVVAVIEFLSLAALAEAETKLRAD
jgi:hypothetical protein